MTEALRALHDCLSAEADLHGSLVPLEPPKSFGQQIMTLVDPVHPVQTLFSLDTLREYLTSSVLTSIDTQRTQPVFGEGNPRASIMLVGEAPGAEEDLTGRPFVGRAGQLLDKMLAAIELTRSEIYIANILKTRPPNNRDPLPEEISAHLPILYRQMSLIQPRFILCLGRIAAQTLLGCSTPLG